MPARLPPSAAADKGRILVCDAYHSIFDGVSEAESYGFMDKQDLPPLDTWFHILTLQQLSYLCAWTPAPFVRLAQAAIDVNAVDCIGWMDEVLPDVYRDVSA